MHHLGRKALLAIAPLALIVGLLAGPAMASADVTFEAGGEVLAPGTPIIAEGTNLKTKTEFGFGPTLECANVFVEGEVLVNPGEPAVLGNGLGEGEECSAAGEPVQVTEVILKNDEFFENGTDVADFEFVYLLEGGARECRFVGENIPTTWEANGTVHIVTPNALVGSGGVGCPANGELSGDLTLTSLRRAVTIS